MTDKIDIIIDGNKYKMEKNYQCQFKNFYIWKSNGVFKCDTLAGSGNTPNEAIENVRARIRGKIFSHTETKREAVERAFCKWGEGKKE